MPKILRKIYLPPWLIFVLLGILIFRIPSFFEPYFYGDEMIYLALGRGIRMGIPLYSGIHDNKPPLLYLMAALAGNLFWFKAILAFWMMATTVLFSKLSQVIFKSEKKPVIISTVVFAILTTIPLLEGNIVNAELFMIGPIIGAFIILLSKKDTAKNIFLAGILLSIASLFKMPAAFDMPVIIVFWIITQTLSKKTWRKILLNSVYLLIGFFLPIAASMAWFFAQGAGIDYITAAYLQNVGYLSSFRPEDVEKNFLLRNLPLLIRGGLVITGSLIVFWRKKFLSKEFIFISLWLFFGLFAVTLSERPYPHYLIQVVAQISLLITILFTKRNKEQIWAIFPLILVAFVPLFYNYYHYKSYPYYSRFINIVSKKISLNDYWNSFDVNTTRNYQIALFLANSSQPQDRVFIVGDSPAIYALSRRLPSGKYVAGYHINDFSNWEREAESLSANLPQFIVILPEKINFSPIIPLIRANYLMVSEIGNAEIWKLKTFR